MKLKNKVKEEEYLIQGKIGGQYIQWGLSDREGKLTYRHGVIKDLNNTDQSFLLNTITAKLEDFLPFLLGDRFNSNIRFTIYDLSKNKVVSFSPINAKIEIEKLLGYLPIY